MHLVQIGSTTTINTQKDREEDLDMLLDPINKESRIRREINIEKTEFLTKCENFPKQIITTPEGVNIEKPLDRAYQLFDSVVSKLQMPLQER